MESEEVKLSEIIKHKGIMSAEFWVKHDPEKCEVCKKK